MLWAWLKSATNPSTCSLTRLISFPLSHRRERHLRLGQCEGNLVARGSHKHPHTSHWYASVRIIAMCALYTACALYTSAEDKWRVLPDYKPKPHFWQKHPTRTKVLTALGIGSIGLVIGLTQRHSCPKVYDGKPYDGTPPCPK